MTIYDASMRYARRGRAARRARGQGVRLRELARLGREGLAAARRARGDRRSRSSASIVRTSSGWVCCRCSSPTGESAATLGLTGHEVFRLIGRRPRSPRTVRCRARSGCTPTARQFETIARIDTPFERDVFLAGGILPVHLAALASRRVRAAGGTRSLGHAPCLTPGFPRGDRGVDRRRDAPRAPRSWSTTSSACASPASAVCSTSSPPSVVGARILVGACRPTRPSSCSTSTTSSSWTRPASSALVRLREHAQLRATERARAPR